MHSVIKTNFLNCINCFQNEIIHSTLKTKVYLVVFPIMFHQSPNVVLKPSIPSCQFLFSIMIHLFPDVVIDHLSSLVVLKLAQPQKEHYVIYMSPKLNLPPPIQHILHNIMQLLNGICLRETSYKSVKNIFIYNFIYNA